MRALDPLNKAGIVLGIGFGGFADGIVLHQILGWHHVICETASCRPGSVAQLERQNVQDGFFHLAVWLVTLLGTAMLFRAATRQRGAWSASTLIGAMLAGWGVFNFVEGLVNHQILGLHHVLPGHRLELLWDLLFLATGPLFVGLGWRLCRRAADRTAPHARAGSAG